MRVLLCLVVLLSLAAFASAGERFPTFSRSSPLQAITLPTKYEKLPEVTLPTKVRAQSHCSTAASGLQLRRLSLALTLLCRLLCCRPTDGEGRGADALHRPGHHPAQDHQAGHNATRTAAAGARCILSLLLDSGLTSALCFPLSLQPIVQQRLVYQPVVRTRVLHQPIVRHVYAQNIIRPHVRSQETVRPVYQVQDVLVPKITTQDRVQEEFTKTREQLQTQTKPASYEGKSRTQMYGQPDYSAATETQAENYY